MTTSQFLMKRALAAPVTAPSTGMRVLKTMLHAFMGGAHGAFEGGMHGLAEHGLTGAALGTLGGGAVGAVAGGVAGALDK